MTTILTHEIGIILFKSTAFWWKKAICWSWEWICLGYTKLLAYRFLVIKSLRKSFMFLLKLRKCCNNWWQIYPLLSYLLSAMRIRYRRLPFTSLKTGERSLLLEARIEKKLVLIFKSTAILQKSMKAITRMKRTLYPARVWPESYYANMTITYQLCNRWVGFPAPSLIVSLLKVLRDYQDWHNLVKHMYFCSWKIIYIFE